jgi:hypothetical protein
MCAALRKTWDMTRDGCVDEEDKKDEPCSTRIANRLHQPFPRVFTFNITWSGEQSPRDILRMMLSFNGRFNSQHLYGKASES